MPAIKSSRCSNTDRDQPVIWAVIPARGGSKRLPRKNVMSFCGGDSLTFRTAHKAVASGCFARVLVSTDDHDIADEAKRAGAMVPFLRPDFLADDQASSVDVLWHAFSYLLETDKVVPDAVCLLQVTSPMLCEGHLREAITRFFCGKFNSLSSMTLVKQYPEWMYRVDEVCGSAVPENSAGIETPTACIPRRYIENGALYLVKGEWFRQQRKLYDYARHGCLQMSAEDSVDIDTMADWEYAEYLFARRMGR